MLKITIALVLLAIASCLCSCGLTVDRSGIHTHESKVAGYHVVCPSLQMNLVVPKAELVAGQVRIETDSGGTIETVGNVACFVEELSAADLARIEAQKQAPAPVADKPEPEPKG